MRWAFVAYVAGQMMIFAFNPSPEPLTSFLGILIRCAIAYAVVASAANYNQYFGTMLRVTLPTELGNVVAGTTDAPPLQGATFDGIWNKAWAGGLAVYRNLPWTLKAIGLTVCIAFYWIAAIACIGVSFMVFIGADLILAVLVAVGVLFVAVFPFPATRPYFDRWLSACLSMVLLRIFIVTLLALLVRAENETILAIATSGMGVGWDSGSEIAQLQLLFGGLLLFFICGAIAKQLPSVALAVTGGVVADAQGPWARSRQRPPDVREAWDRALIAQRKARGRSVPGPRSARQRLSPSRPAGRCPMTEMRLLALMAVLACAACADDHALPATSDSDPTWQLNKGHWELGGNELTTAPDANATPVASSLPPQLGGGS